MAQGVSCWLKTAKARLNLTLLGVEFVVDKVTEKQVFSKYSGFPLSVSFHQCSILIHSTITDAYMKPAILSVVKQHRKMLCNIHPVAPDCDSSRNSFVKDTVFILPVPPDIFCSI